MEYLNSKSCDFFTSPASSRYHNCFEGGLVEHSLNVYDCLKASMSTERSERLYGEFSDETLAIVALLHDVCKANSYKVSMRNVKNQETGKWESVPYYDYDDILPYGHGEKSVYIITGFMRLTREEAFAIRYHMGFSSNDEKGAVSKVFASYPLAFALSVADMEATYLIEDKNR